VFNRVLLTNSYVLFVVILHFCIKSKPYLRIIWYCYPWRYLRILMYCTSYVHLSQASTFLAHSHLWASSQWISDLCICFPAYSFSYATKRLPSLETYCWAVCLVISAFHVSVPDTKFVCTNWRVFVLPIWWAWELVILEATLAPFSIGQCMWPVIG